MTNMKISDIDEGKIRIGGRTIECRNPVTLCWSGSYVEFLVKAGEFRILVEGPYETFENWIAIEINGEVLSRRMVSKDKEWITVFRMMNPDIPTRVRIIKEVQAFESDPQHRLCFHELETDGELLDVEEKKLKIEFIGDSINSAEGCIGATGEMEWIAQFFSHTNSYPYMVGKSLDADIRVFSQSGWGVYASFDCNCDHTIPKYYEGICSLMAPGYFDRNGFYDKWDFSKWQPDYVIINLGTNDDGAFNNNECDNRDELRLDGDKYNEQDRVKVRDAIADFLQMVRTNNPAAKIFWAFGILGDKMIPTIQEAMEMYTGRTGDNNIAFIRLPDTKEGEFGSRWHPGRIAHENAAGVIVKTLLSGND